MNILWIWIKQAYEIYTGCLPYTGIDMSADLAINPGAKASKGMVMTQLNRVFRIEHQTCGL